MGRTRLLHPDFFLDEELAACGMDGMLLFEGLWGQADREGRLLDRPARIKHHALPYFAVDVDAILDRLSANGFIIRYRAGDVRLIQIVNFKKYQRPHRREALSQLPEFTSECEKVSPRTVPGPALDGPRLPVSDTVSDTVYPYSPLPKKGQSKDKPYTDNFLRWYAEYPRKVGKAAAWRAWQRGKCDANTEDLIADTRLRTLNDRNWLKDEGEFIPHPATYLNGRRWEDALETGHGKRIESPQDRHRRLAGIEPNDGPLLGKDV